MPTLRPAPPTVPPTKAMRDALQGVDLATLEQQLADSYGKLLLAYPAEIARRRLEQANVQAFEVAGEGAPFIPGGSLLIVTGHPDDEMLGELAAAGGRGDAAAV